MALVSLASVCTNYSCSWFDDPQRTATTLQGSRDGGSSCDPRAGQRTGRAQCPPRLRRWCARRFFDQPRFSAGTLPAHHPSGALGVSGALAGRELSRRHRQRRLSGPRCPVNAYWADNARIDETHSPEDQPEAREIAAVREQSGWNGLYFGGTAFKKQREVAPEQYKTAARVASRWMDVVTTSGIATGHAAAQSKIVDIRAGCGDTPLALASGVTPDNALHYAKAVDCFLVATGINVSGDFYNLDPDQLEQLLRVANAQHLIQHS